MAADLLPTILDLQAVLVPALLCAGILFAALGYLVLTDKPPAFQAWWLP